MFIAFFLKIIFFKMDDVNLSTVHKLCNKYKTINKSVVPFLKVVYYVHNKVFTHMPN